MKPKNFPLPKQPARSGTAWLLRTARALRLLLLLLLTLPAVVQAQFNYTTNNGTIVITGYTGLGGELGIPDTINSLPVTGIGERAFYNHSSLTRVTIPSSINSIGDYAFAYCASLTDVTIGSGVTSIGIWAFFDCTSLMRIMIPDSVTNIGNEAFQGCTSLRSVTIGNGVTSIGTRTFQGCRSLRSVTIPSSVTSIGGFAFANCGRLTSITIPSGVTRIGAFAFSGCGSLSSVIIPSGVTSIDYQAFSYCRSLTAITVDADNSTYGSVDGVLLNKSRTTLIQCPGGKTGNYTIPSSVTSIGELAFQYCEDLASVTIPTSVTNIWSSAFVRCTSLNGVYFQGDSPSFGSQVFDDTTATVYYLPGTTGWGPTFGSRPTALWVLPTPLILNNGSRFGVQANQFGFIISWATNLSVVVEACTDLAQPIWSPVGTNTLTDGSSYFSDPQWTNHPARFYRLRSP